MPRLRPSNIAEGTMLGTTTERAVCRASITLFTGLIVVGHIQMVGPRFSLHCQDLDTDCISHGQAGHCGCCGVRQWQISYNMILWYIRMNIYIYIHTCSVCEILGKAPLFPSWFWRREQIICLVGGGLCMALLASLLKHESTSTPYERP